MKLFQSLIQISFFTIFVDSKHHKEVRNEHEIVYLPGIKYMKDIPFTQYAGRIELPSNEKMFYWYAESQTNPQEDPIVLWLNGGPGCSSLGGFFTENGPFVVQSDLSLKLNEYAWNQRANIVWVESPAGVGFSTPIQADDSYYNDDVVAERLHTFISLFFNKYPELKNRDFYITGESYGGMYIPYIVDELLQAPLDGVNLKGFAIGNPLTDLEIDGNAYMDYYYTHALTSRQMYHSLLQSCSSEVGHCLFQNTDCSDACQNAIDNAFVAADVSHFNPYYIYGDVCLMNNNQGTTIQRHFSNKLKESQEKRWDELVEKASRGDIGVCADVFTEQYLNQDEVQDSLHLDLDRENGEKIHWVDCKMDIRDRFRLADSALPKYKSIMAKNDLNIMIYSGDADSVVNFMGTERWITQDGLNLKETSTWKAWYGPDKQIAGYVQEYDGLTYRTVKGAGHMVPTIRPLHGLFMFECYIHGEEACSSFNYPHTMFEIASGEFGMTYGSREKKRDVNVSENTLNAGKSVETEQEQNSWSMSTILTIPVVGSVAIMFAVLLVRVRNQSLIAARRHEERMPLFQQGRN